MAMTDDSPTTMREFELIRELRGAVGLFDGALPISPKAAWEEAIRRVQRLQQLHDDVLAGLQKADR